VTGPAPVILVAATPTPNGDLHLGHLAGPYLAADIYARRLRAAGREVRYVSCTDDSQTYVVSTAARLGVTPARLTAESTAAIENSLRIMGISMAPLPPVDDRYRRAVLDFVTALHRAGRFRLRTVRLPYDEAAGRYLYDGLVGGSCPTCLAGSSGGVCEDCGHPNNYDELLDARPTGGLGPATVREARILVLPMEEYRQRLVDYFDDHPDWRPHPAQLIRELLAGPLPDIPITVPGDWGIEAPFPETPGQRLYPWIEAMPASMYATWWAGAESEQTGPVDAAWRAEAGAELVYFHGFDNTYHWGLMDLVLLMAHGDRYVLPTANVCNEFYELAGAKFSTSRGHLMRADELLAEVPRDLVRFYLTLTAPEHQRSDFTVDRLREVCRQRLVEPWHVLADALELATLTGALPTDGPLPVTADGRRRAAAITERFAGCYRLPGFSIARAAETIAGQLARLAAAVEADGLTGDLLAQLRALLAGAAPILIDAAEAAQAAGWELSTAPAAELVPVPLPRLGRPASEPVHLTEVLP